MEEYEQMPLYLSSRAMQYDTLAQSYNSLMVLLASIIKDSGGRLTISHGSFNLMKRGYIIGREDGFDGIILTVEESGENGT